jgi:hypothetical protein
MAGGMQNQTLSYAHSVSGLSLRDIRPAPMLLVGPADAPYNAQTLRQIALNATAQYDNATDGLSKWPFALNIVGLL